MATMNPFYLLDDNDNDDPSQLIAAQQKKLEVAKDAPKNHATANQQSKTSAAPAKMPSKPLPPAQAVRETRNEPARGGRGGVGGRGRGRAGRGGRGFNPDSSEKENSFVSNNGFSGGYKPAEDGESGKPYERRGPGGPRGGFRGGRRGGFSNGEVVEGERPRRMFERRSGTGRGTEFKRDGAGRGNWGTPTDEFVAVNEEPVGESEKAVETENQLGEESVGDANKETPDEKVPEEKEPEDKEMTLEEYEKVLEEKRKALLSMKAEERKVNLDKDFESMQLLSNKKNDDDVFIKLNSEKDKRKEAAEKDEKAKKSVSINEFLKPADGEGYQRPGGRGRGRGCGRGASGFGGNSGLRNAEAPSIEDVGEFPSLVAK